MSYESKMLKTLDMPPRKEVEIVILKSLFKNNGTIKEFSANEDIVKELADHFKLNEKQRTAYLETIYSKENRIKRSSLWHRLLFRAADSLAKKNYITRPTDTIHLTNKREWMLTEKGVDKALKMFNIPKSKKDFISTKTFEVQKIVRKLKTARRPKVYHPYRFKGKDDIWNALALCHLHHWAFDVGWFTLSDNNSIILSSKIDLLPSGFGKFGEIDFIKNFNSGQKIILPNNKNLYPHQNPIHWHRKHIFINK